MIRISTRMSRMGIDKNNKKSFVGAWWQAGLALFLKLSAWIVFPVIVSIYVGRYLDKFFHTAPWLSLVSVIATFILSMVMIVRIGLKEMEK